MKLGLTLGYWGAQPPVDALDKILEAERLGYDIVFTAESWGSDALTPLAWWGSHTSTIRHPPSGEGPEVWKISPSGGFPGGLTRALTWS